MGGGKKHFFRLQAVDGITTFTDIQNAKNQIQRNCCWCSTILIKMVAYRYVKKNKKGVEVRYILRSYVKKKIFCLSRLWLRFRKLSSTIHFLLRGITTSAFVYSPMYITRCVYHSAFITERSIIYRIIWGHAFVILQNVANHAVNIKIKSDVGVFASPIFKGFFATLHDINVL